MAVPGGCSIHRQCMRSCARLAIPPARSGSWRPGDPAYGSQGDLRSTSRRRPARTSGRQTSSSHRVPENSQDGYVSPRHARQTKQPRLTCSCRRSAPQDGHRTSHRNPPWCSLRRTAVTMIGEKTFVTSSLTRARAGPRPERPAAATRSRARTAGTWGTRGWCRRATLNLCDARSMHTIARALPSATSHEFGSYLNLPLSKQIESK